MTSGSASSGAWPWPGTSRFRRCGRRALIAATVSRDSRSDSAPRITISGLRRQRVELRPRAAAAAVPASTPPSVWRARRHRSGPARRLPFEGALRTERANLHRSELGNWIRTGGARSRAALFEARRLGQLADVALDPHQPFDLDHRADVVEHRAGDASGCVAPAAWSGCRRARCRRRSPAMFPAAVRRSARRRARPSTL